MVLSCYQMLTIPIYVVVGNMYMLNNKKTTSMFNKKQPERDDNIFGKVSDIKKMVLSCYKIPYYIYLCCSRHHQKAPLPRCNRNSLRI